MRLDKLAYLGLSVFTLVIIIIVIVLGNYGTNISSDRNFIAFFKWYIFLLVFNMLNIFVTLVFHYIMADVQGVQGLKGYTGDKGLPGENAKCFCDMRDEGSEISSIAGIDLTSDIKTREVTDLEDNRVGTLIYHDSEPPATEPLNVGMEIM